MDEHLARVLLTREVESDVFGNLLAGLLVVLEDEVQIAIEANEIEGRR